MQVALLQRGEAAVRRVVADGVVRRLLHHHPDHSEHVPDRHPEVQVPGATHHLPLHLLHVRQRRVSRE